MGIALQLISTYVANPSTTITATAAQANESLSVPSFNPSSKAFMFNPWPVNVTGGTIRFRSARFHDVAQGIRLQAPANIFDPIMTPEMQQPIYPSDALIVETSGGATETDLVNYLQYFQDLPGVAARLSMWGDISARIKSFMGDEVDVAASATAGLYGTARALNYSFDTFKANTDYALLGYTCSAPVAVVCLYGPDTGNQHIGGPGVTDQNDIVGGYFKWLSDHAGVPCIPIINANNRGSTYIQIADHAASTAIKVSLLMAELGA